MPGRAKREWAMGGRAAALALVWAALAGPAAADTAAPGAWSSRVQPLFDAATGRVERRLLTVWDPHPGLDLDFTFEPAPGRPIALGPDGALTGEGRLVFRVKGAAPYDKGAVFSAYRGALKDGRPDGQGRLELRSGEIFQGSFRAGLLDGPGLHVDAAGNRFEGRFRAGLPDGEGRLALSTGEVYRGPFEAGLRHGLGETMLPGGTRYVSRWTAGVEEKGKRPGGVGDALAGGFLRAQDGASGDAARAQIAVSVDGRMTQQADMRYQSFADENGIAITPENELFVEAWNGTRAIDTEETIFTGVDWEDAPAFVAAELSAADGKRVKLDRMSLEVESSETYRKPMLSIAEHAGCVGFRPSFTFRNNGWGEARNVRLSLAFTGDVYGAAEGETLPRSRSFDVAVGTIGDGADVTIDGALREAGVDTAKLAAQRFECPSAEALNVCRAKAMNAVGFGEIADFVYGEGLDENGALIGGDVSLKTMAVGQVEYDWADDAGVVTHASEPFQAAISLAVIEFPHELAECGDGFGGSPEALRYLDIRLPTGRQNYAVDLPLRGNRSVTRYAARMKLSSETSSVHRFRVAARFADGTERRSPPVSFFFFRPKPSTFESRIDPGQCYLPPTLGGCDG